MNSLEDELAALRRLPCDPGAAAGKSPVHAPVQTQGSVFVCGCGAKWEWDGRRLHVAKLSPAQTQRALK